MFEFHITQGGGGRGGGDEKLNRKTVGQQCGNVTLL